MDGGEQTIRLYLCLLKECQLGSYPSLDGSSELPYLGTTARTSEIGGQCRKEKRFARAK